MSKPDKHNHQTTIKIFEANSIVWETNIPYKVVASSQGWNVYDSCFHLENMKNSSQFDVEFFEKFFSNNVVGVLDQTDVIMVLPDSFICKKITAARDTRGKYCYVIVLHVFSCTRELNGYVAIEPYMPNEIGPTNCAILNLMPFSENGEE